MKRSFEFSAAFILLLFHINASSQIKGFDKIKWEREKIAPGLTWKSAHTFVNDTVPQNINILLVNLRKREIGLEYSPGKNVRTSQQASEAGALASVNAGFFDVKNGGSVTYIRTGGKITDADTASKWKKNVNLNGAVMVSGGHHVIIEQTHQNSWFDSHPEFEDILVTGPLLAEDGSPARMPATSLVISRHPRTAIGVRNMHKVILLTLDGRTSEAAGMTLKELASFMILLKCRDAVNLDGGGSTTMWIRGKPFSGVVNMPSDNKKFDHEGERAVSNIVVVK